jgi:hypothetical protein
MCLVTSSEDCLAQRRRVIQVQDANRNRHRSRCADGWFDTGSLMCMNEVGNNIFLLIQECNNALLFSLHALQVMDGILLIISSAIRFWFHHDSLVCACLILLCHNSHSFMLKILFHHMYSFGKMVRRSLCSLHANASQVELETCDVGPWHRASVLSPIITCCDIGLEPSRMMQSESESLSMTGSCDRNADSHKSCAIKH